MASAAAIWERLEARVRPFAASSFLAVPERDLRRAGLSRVKIATLRGVARAIDEGTLDLDALTHAPEEAIHAELTALKGIGPWTADIYILFCLARADAWSPGDLALQYAVKDALALDDRPGLEEMVEIAEAWRPWRSVAARLLWAYYGLRRHERVAPSRLPPEEDEEPCAYPSPFHCLPRVRYFAPRPPGRRLSAPRFCPTLQATPRVSSNRPPRTSAPRP